MATTISKTFSAAGVSAESQMKPGESFTYDITGSSFEGTAVLQTSRNSGTWQVLATASGDSGTPLSSSGASGTVKNEDSKPRRYRFQCITRDAGSAICTLTPAMGVADKQIVLIRGKVGATAGFAVDAADNLSLATCPASQTASTLVVPVTGLKVGSIITGFHLVGQIESAANHVTVDAELRKHTAAAADVSDASVASITQLDVTADTIMSALNTRIGSLSEVIGADETFYVLITVTTAASTDVALQGVAVEFTEA